MTIHDPMAKRKTVTRTVRIDEAYDEICARVKLLKVISKISGKFILFNLLSSVKTGKDANNVI